MLCWILTRAPSRLQPTPFLQPLYDQHLDFTCSNAADTSLPPWEVVALLNDLHNMYDSILAKHKLVKIRRSGGLTG